MTSMSYCRHENTAAELQNVWDQWEDFEATDQYEIHGRRQIVALVREMHEKFVLDGTYDS